MDPVRQCLRFLSLRIKRRRTSIARTPIRDLEFPASFGRVCPWGGGCLADGKPAEGTGGKDVGEAEKAADNGRSRLARGVRAEISIQIKL